MTQTRHQKIITNAHTPFYIRWLPHLHLDLTLLGLIVLVVLYGFIILYSASNQHLKTVQTQLFHFGIGLITMLALAQISPVSLKRYAPWLYGLGLILLIIVLAIGHIGKGGQRWINLGFMRFQPAEIMKLAIPFMLAWYYHKVGLPLRLRSLFIAFPIILVPFLLTAKQPDLGTAILLMIGGAGVLFFAGLTTRIIVGLLTFMAACIPFVWYLLYDYQRNRVLTFLNPENDPLGKGYHIIQSKIAIGSGGLFGKGWLEGTQSNLHFLPEHTTDFIFAVGGEELGFVGSLALIVLYMLIVCRGLYITTRAQDTFSRLLAGSITLIFFASFFINIGMVSGILPVVGVPLPLISYGGSAMVTMMANFGILMSINTHRKLVTT